MLARQKTESIVPERRLASHLSTILGIPQDDPDVERYLAALQAEGYRTTPSFDHLALGELAEKPFNFKAGDLKTVCLCMRAPMGVRGRRPWCCGSGGLGGGDTTHAPAIVTRCVSTCACTCLFPVLSRVTRVRALIMVPCFWFLFCSNFDLCGCACTDCSLTRASGTGRYFASTVAVKQSTAATTSGGAPTCRGC